MGWQKGVEGEEREVEGKGKEGATEQGRRGGTGDQMCGVDPWEVNGQSNCGHTKRDSDITQILCWQEVFLYEPLRLGK